MLSHSARERIFIATTDRIIGDEISNAIDDGPQIYEATADTDATTTSATYVVMTGMNVTPPAGRYSITFSSSQKANAGGINVLTAVFVGGVIIANSVRRRNSAVDAGIACETIATTDGSQTIDIRWQVDGGGTATVHERALIVHRVA